MQISVTDAKAKLTELVRRAEADEEIILTRHGQPVVRLRKVNPYSEIKCPQALEQPASAWTRTSCSSTLESINFSAFNRFRLKAG